ncbi:MAG: zf-HC2 domain-containing protein [Cyanobacteria bacterium SZAS-4]|nr:zf-HC2 domain-containing protein [Cyanobacteria bacterium SZAS-4]
MSNDFNCKQLEPLLSAYHDGELTEAERADADRHLNGCADCQNRLLEISAVATSLKSLPRLNPKTDVAANIEQLIANQPKGISRIQPPVIWGAAGIAAAAAVLLVAGNFKAVTNQANNPLTANSKTNQVMPKPMPNAVKSQELEIAHNLDTTANPIQDFTEPAQISAHHDQSSAPNGTVSKKEGGMPTQHEKPTTDNNAKKNSKFNPHLQVASNGNEGATNAVATNAVATASGSQSDASAPQLIANRNVGTASIGGADSSLVAIYDTEQRGVTEELGITTDEDGLYAIKL